MKHCLDLLTFHGLARPPCVLLGPMTRMVVGAVSTLLHIPPPSWAVKKGKKEINQKYCKQWDDLLKQFFSLSYLYSRISILVSVLVEVMLLQRPCFGGRLGGLRAVRQWRHGRQRPLAVQVLLQVPVQVHTNICTLTQTHMGCIFSTLKGF